MFFKNEYILSPVLSCPVLEYYGPDLGKTFLRQKYSQPVLISDILVFPAGELTFLTVYKFT
jgi:hypothetical protein